MCLAQGHKAVTPVRLELAAPLSRVKHSTTEPLPFLLNYDVFLSVKVVLILAKTVHCADPDEMQHCCISPGSSLFAKVSSIQRAKPAVFSIGQDFCQCPPTYIWGGGGHTNSIHFLPVNWNSVSSHNFGKFLFVCLFYLILRLIAMAFVDESAVISAIALVFISPVIFYFYKSFPE